MPLSRSVLSLVALGSLWAVLAATPTQAQTPTDSLRADTLSTVVVTATRTARALEDVPVPTTVLGREEIAASGTLRLADLLAEQPGLVVAPGLGGAGLQMQGFDSDYTLILIDGEPVVGRTAGTLDLERLPVTGVERVEIVRGPLSARYGADALAGVVNLITRRPGMVPTARGRVQLESHGVSDTSVEAEAGGDRWGVRAFASRYGSDGYSVQPDLGTLAVPVFADYTADLRTRLAPTDRTDLGLSVRASSQTQDGAFILAETLYDETADRLDVSLNPTLKHRFSSRLRLDADLYGAHYENTIFAAARESGDVFEDTEQTHDYGKAEVGLTWLPSLRHVVTAGTGITAERIGGDRYAATTPTASQPYGFAEYSWQPTRLFDVVVSARYDAPSDYAARFTPKAAVLVRPFEGLRLRGSIGSGYKAPAFRQRYLSFTNGAVGYAVFGAEEVREALNALDAAGGISQFLISPSGLAPLRAESSTAFGLGFEIEPVRDVVVKVNGFHNEVRDLIDTQPVAVKTNGQQVFSYFNLARIYTRGIETEVSATVLRSPVLGQVTLGGGYQLLDTADRDILDQIDAGLLFYRDPDGRDVRLTRDGYGGLRGRSRHSGTVRLTHTLPRWGLTTAARATFRSRYGFADLNGNLALDEAREYAPGFALVHLTLTKTLGNADLQLGIRNLLNHTDAVHLPSEAGRVFFVGAGYRF